MEQNNHKFRLRLNLFDAIVLVVVLLARLLWLSHPEGQGNGRLRSHHPDRAVHRAVPEDE